jgi:hypothetical protein
MSKTVLIIISLLVLLMGLLALFAPGWLGATEPTWHAVAKVVVGLIGLYVGASDKEEK